MAHIVELQVLQNQRLVRASTESLTQRKKEHRHRVDVEVGEKIENEKGNDIGPKCHKHGLAPSKSIRKHPGRNFEEIGRYIPNGIQNTDLQKTQALFTEEQNQKRFKKTQVL